MKRLNKNLCLNRLSVFILLVVVSFSVLPSIHARPLKRKVRIYLVRQLGRVLAQVERKARKKAGRKYAKKIRNVTLKMQLYIEDITISYGDSFVMRPYQIYKIILRDVKRNVKKKEIAEHLLQYIKKNG